MRAFVAQEISTPGLPPAGGSKADFDGKVVRGRDGWLFLDKDSNDVMAQHRGERRLSENELEDWRFLLEGRIAWLERRGASYFFLVAPNPHSVHWEALPEGFGAGERRPVLQLIDHLQTKRSYARLIYPIDELRSEARRAHVYSKTQSHWTELGAFVAYRRLMSDIGGSASVPVLTEEDVVLEEEESIGGLGRKVEPPQSSSSVAVAVRNPKARFVADNRVQNIGRRIEFSCDSAPPVRCVIFGDSFAERLLPFLAESFSRLVFAHHPAMDFGLVESEQAEIVIYVMNERFLIRVPHDLKARRLAEWEAEKRAAGLMYPPRTTIDNRVDNSGR